MELKFEKGKRCWLFNYETNTNSKCTNFMTKHNMRKKVKAFLRTKYVTKLVTVMIMTTTMMVRIIIIMSLYNKNA
jgi:hypothetical protein